MGSLDHGAIDAYNNSQPAALWTFPTADRLKATKPGKGIAGATRPDPVPRYFAGVEPPFVVDLLVLTLRHADDTRIVPFLHHVFRTAIDMKRKRIFHYGAGLKTSEYVSFDEEGFSRGRLWALPLVLPE